MSEVVARRVYRGVWRVLADVFRVPEHAPTLLDARSESMRPAEGFLRRMKVIFWIVLLLTDVLFTVLWIASFFIEWWVGVLLFPVYLAVAIVPDILAWIALHLRYDTTWYVLGERSLRIRRGIWVITETTITYENVQNVRVLQGPLQRHFGISSLVVETAGGGGAPQGGEAGAGPHVGLLEGLGDAAVVRDRIMTRVKRSRTAGLGDDEAGAEEVGGWSAAHVAVLREIRGLLARTA